MKNELPSTLREHGIRPSPQRLAVAGACLRSEDHLSAEAIHDAARRRG